MAKIVTGEAIANYSDEKGNRIIGVPTHADKFEVSFAGSNNELHLGSRTNLSSTRILFDSSGGRVHIDEGSVFRGIIRTSNGGSVSIGKRLSVTMSCYISAYEGQSVSIGDDCMFAAFNEIRTDDAHPIFDKTTGERVNPSLSVEIGNHVWLSSYAAVWGGSKIGNGCVIGRFSFVKAVIPDACIAVGMPARVVRENVVWDKTHIGTVAPYMFDTIEDLPRAPWGEAEG